MKYGYELDELPVSGITIPDGRVEADRHAPEKVASMTASMAERGLLYPIVVDRNRTLIDGERRLRIARSLGWPRIEVRIVLADRADLTELDLLELARIGNVERGEVSAFAVEEYARRKDRLLGADSPGLTVLTRETAAEHGMSPSTAERARRIAAATRHPHPEVRAEAAAVRSEIEATGRGYLTAGARIAAAERRAEEESRLPISSIDEIGASVTPLHSKHEDVETAASLLAAAAQYGAQITSALHGLTSLHDELAAIAPVHRGGAMASRSDATVEVLREVVGLSLDELDGLRGLLARELAALDEAVEYRAQAA